MSADIIPFPSRSHQATPSSMPVLARRLATGEQRGLNDLKQDSVLAPFADSPERRLVDAIKRDAQVFGRDRSWRVVDRSSQDRLEIGDVATVRQRELNGCVDGDEREQTVQQLGRCEPGLKVGRIHGFVLRFVARIKAAFVQRPQ